jgi:hypothetical protein
MPHLPPGLRLLTLLVCLSSALYMTGVIWTVQLVHYALFNLVGKAAWPAYHAAHTQRMTWVVLLPMVLELGTSGLLALSPPGGLPRPLLVLGFLLTVGTWAVTFFVSVPLHGRLGEGWDEAAWRSLVGTNWARTALWTGHAAVMLTALWRLLAMGYRWS